MKPLKTILRNGAVRAVLCWLVSLYIRLVHATGFWRVVGGDTPARLWDAGKPFILCFWHGRLLMMPKSWRRSRPIHMLISEHRDGQLIARTVAHFGILTAAGSSSRGGAAAVRRMVKAIRAGDCVGVTPDGPRGPRMRAGGGIADIARLAGVPIVPATYSARHRRVLGTWDRFIVPSPFSGGVFVWGAPIEIPRDADSEAVEVARRRVEEELNAITAEADRLCGHAPVEPAPAVERDPAHGAPA